MEVLEWDREQANSSRGDINTQVQKHLTWKMAVRPVGSRRGRGPEWGGKPISHEGSEDVWAVTAV